MRAASSGADLGPAWTHNRPSVYYRQLGTCDASAGIRMNIGQGSVVFLFQLAALLHPYRIGEIAAVWSRLYPWPAAKLGSLLARFELVFVLDPADRFHLRTLFSPRGSVSPQLGYVYLVDITTFALSFFLWPYWPTTFVHHGASYQPAFDAPSCLSFFLC